jgi:hypothetical protein
MMRSRLDLGALFVLGVLCSCRATTEIKCAAGFGQEERVIKSEWINDGYCDCPLDGQDEPETEACSGSAVGWAGVNSFSLEER